MSTIMHLNPETALFDPAAEFARPMDIVDEQGLTRGQKLAALRRWAENLQHQLAATSEGMQTPPGTTTAEVATLDEIKKAQILLSEPQDLEPEPAA
ncbi:MAG: hypothetical protein ACREC6_04880 [Hyphomicrobiaceae bacterium]